MIKKIMLSLAIVSTGLAADATESITWQTLGNRLNDKLMPVYTQRFTVTADRPFEGFAFCTFKKYMHPLNPQDTVIEILPGYYSVMSPRFADAVPGQPITVDLITDGAFTRHAAVPDGMHLIVDGAPVRTENTIKPFNAFAEQWSAPGRNGRTDGMVYGEEAYIINDRLRSAYRPTPYGLIPTLKSVKLKEKMVKAPQKYTIRKVSDDRPDYWRSAIDGPKVTVYTSSEHPQAIINDLKRRVEAAKDANGLVPAADIEDWADFSYRGVMIDVARNFLSVEDMKKLIDLAAMYGMNTLHFHVGEDEGWRIEIPSLPELTAVGSRRGYTLTDDVPFLKGIYSGDGNPDATDTPANGFYTVDEYIDLLRYADARGIAVIPEFDSPGHSRAAIRAMEHRYRTTGDDSLRLIHDGDTSVYTTAQDFHDNIMNPALEGPYRFWGIVFDDIIDIYKKAGVKLPAVHIGGDEVPAHAWDGSEAVQRMMADKGIKTQNEVHAHFVHRVADEAAARGIKIGGWQEIALGHSDDYNNAVRPHVAAVNCWTASSDNGRLIAEAGYPLVMSNVDFLYFDHITTRDPQEPGMSWGGIIDEFAPLHATRERLCPGSADVSRNVAGISCHIFSETCRNLGMFERYLLPRLLGLAERAHNTEPTLSDSEYFGLLTAEMDGWAGSDTDFFLRQPGIRLRDGKVEMNHAYADAEIRYTLDGSEPTAQSPLYTAPVAVGNASQVRARLFKGKANSTTTILNVNR
ncbi:MAG: family 20 glycosylhydrolase [Muribaculaceae bacterium]|nr:family 20 glycosylhydrolase [Muribaculaceae bacterium]